MIIPPMVGIILVCNLRVSPGASNKRFSIATLINDGVDKSTTKKEVTKTSIKNAIFKNLDSYSSHLSSTTLRQTRHTERRRSVTTFILNIKNHNKN